MFFRIIFNIIYYFDLLFDKKKNRSYDEILKKIELLTLQNDTLSEKNETITQENVSLNEKNETITQDNVTLTKENELIKEQYYILTKENKLIIQQCDSITKENTILTQHYETLKQDKVTLNENINTLTQEKVTLTEKNETLTQDNVTLTEKNETLTQDKVTLTEKNETLTQDKVTLTEQNETLTQDNVTLTEKNQTLNENIKTLTQERDIINTLNTFNNTVLFELLELYTGYGEAIDLTNSTEITINNTYGTTVCKYLNNPDIIVSSIKLDNIKINDNDIHFSGFIGNDNYIYIIIPNIVNENNINVLHIGNDCSIQITHNFVPEIESIKYTLNGDKTFNIVVNGKNLLPYSNVIINPTDIHHIDNIIPITEFTTNSDYTCIICNNIFDIYEVYTSEYMIEICNYNSYQTSKLFDRDINTSPLEIS